MRFSLLLLLVAGTAFAQTAPAPADSNETKRFLDELQRLDDAFFDDEVRVMDATYRDSLVTQFEELGFEGYREEAEASMRTFRFDWSPFSTLWSYNRVEGLVPSVRARVRPFGPRGLALTGDAGWATGPGALRWKAGLEMPLFRRGIAGHSGGLFARASYGDQVVAFGSNRPLANSLRAVVAGADEQDYLRRRGGRAGLEWRMRGASVSVDYVATRELSMSAPASYSLIGDLPVSNPSVDEGIDRAVEARFTWGTGTLRAWSLDGSYRVSGGALAGDFDYARADLRVSRRNYLGRWELQTSAAWARTFRGAPVQRLADAGGVSSVRGFARRALLGDEAWQLRAEAPVPYDLLKMARVPLLRGAGVQFVPWVDAGWVSADGDGAWIHSVGLGVQRHWFGLGRAANVRLDMAVPIGRERPADVVFLMRFAGF